MNQNERACHLDICGIDIPKELNDALAAGKLVVFARRWRFYAAASWIPTIRP